MTTPEWISRIDKIMSCNQGTPPEFTVPQEIINGIHGQTTGETRQFLNALCRGGQDYIEIGTYHGASLLTAAYQNTGHFIGMDDFSIFPEGGECRADLMKNIETFGGENVQFFESSEEGARKHLTEESVDVFFYDGHHGAENTTDAIVRYLPVMRSPFVLVVDDYDWGPPCLGVDRVVKDLPRLGWRLVKSWESPSRTLPVNPYYGIFTGVLERT